MLLYFSTVPNDKICIIVCKWWMAFHIQEQHPSHNEYTMNERMEANPEIWSSNLLEGFFTPPKNHEASGLTIEIRDRTNSAMGQRQQKEESVATCDPKALTTIRRY